MESYVGLDVAKATLEIAVLPSGETWTVTNDDAGVQELLPQLLTLAPTLVVLEATGGFERATVAALAKAGLPVVASPRLRESARAARQNRHPRCPDPRRVRPARAPRVATAPR